MTETTTERRECARHGAFEAKIFRPNIPGLNPIVSNCPECVREQQAQAEAEVLNRARRERAGTVAALNRECGVPSRFASADFTSDDSETAQTRRAIKAARKFADEFPDSASDGRGLVFVGPPGTGKTHIAAAIARTVIDKHLATARYTTAADMARTMRQTFRRDSERSEEEVFEWFATVDLLIVDEIGTGSSQHDRTLLFEVIDARYAESLPSIFISNLSVEELEQYLGERAFDRLAETCNFLPMTGNSRRRSRTRREPQESKA